MWTKFLDEHPFGSRVALGIMAAACLMGIARSGFNVGRALATHGVAARHF